MTETPPGGAGDDTDPGERAYSWGGAAGAATPDPDATQAMPAPQRRSADQPPVTRPEAEPTRLIPSWQQRSPAAQRPAVPPLPPPRLPPPSTAPYGATAAAKRPTRRRRWWLRIILALLLVWVLFLVAVPIWAWSQIARVNAQPSGSRPADQPGTTYLVVGSDSRAGLDAAQRRTLSTGGNAGNGRTDTIMLLHIGSGSPLLVSIPRDSLVAIPGHGTTKINAAFAYGGPKLLVQTIEQDTGVRIDDYVEIGFGGFVNLVDAVGGVRVCAQQAIKDPKAGLTGANAIQKGCQDVNGVQALGFARTRATFATSDIQRIQDQRQVIGAIGNKATSVWSVLNPVRYFRLASAGASSVRIGDNMSPLSLARFAWALAHVSGGAETTCTVPISDLAVHWDPTRAPQLFKLIQQDRTGDIPKSLCTSNGLAP